jgi:hypothetical protein
LKGWDGLLLRLGTAVKLTNHPAWALARERGLMDLQKRQAFAY